METSKNETGKRVLLLAMPFLTLRRPHLGLGLLKSELTQRGIGCDIRYYNFRFAEVIGTPVYERIGENTPTHHNAGEFIFTTALYDDARPFDDFKTVITYDPKRYDEDFFRQMERARNLAPAFVHECAGEIDFDKYDIVGLTSTFQQNIASLAMAQEIKRRAPHIITVCGGANFEGVMGVELHRQFPFVDIVCSGEADDIFPELVRRLRAGEPVHEMAGVTCRLGGETVTGATPQTFITSLNDLPYPDHTDYFYEFRAAKEKPAGGPELTMETSRGCWWGQKHHCTFCGLNGLSMTYRSKSPERAFHEIKYLLATYGGLDVFNTDNIIDLRYFSELFPRLISEGIKAKLFYETKANLKKTQLMLFKKVGTYSIQPGIENLNSHVLALMDKGIKGIQNVQLLRWAREMDLDVQWTIIYGFPGETPQDYQLVNRWIGPITHLQPPISVTRFRLDRFSPMFKYPDKYGIVNVRSYPGTQICYPFPEESLQRIAYFLNCDSPMTQETFQEIIAMWKRVDEWRVVHPGSTLTAEVTPSSLILRDRRHGYRHADTTYHGPAREIYLALDEVHSDSFLLDLIRAKDPAANYTMDDVHGILNHFLERDLVLREDKQYLALALLPLDLIKDDAAEKPRASAELQPQLVSN